MDIIPMSSFSFYFLGRFQSRTQRWRSGRPTRKLRAMEGTCDESTDAPRFTKEKKVFSSWRAPRASRALTVNNTRGRSSRRITIIKHGSCCCRRPGSPSSKLFFFLTNKDDVVCECIEISTRNRGPISDWASFFFNCMAKFDWVMALYTTHTGARCTHTLITACPFLYGWGTPLYADGEHKLLLGARQKRGGKKYIIIIKKRPEGCSSSRVYYERDVVVRRKKSRDKLQIHGRPSRRNTNGSAAVVMMNDREFTPIYSLDTFFFFNSLDLLLNFWLR